MKLSPEQQNILDTTKTGINVYVDAVAGTGKTTLILSIAKELQNKKILQMTYNKSLKFEVREKIEKEEIHNLNVHTYHSLAVCYYRDTAFVDNELRKIIVNKEKPNKEIPHFDILVLDETQDMTFLYFQFMCKFLFDMNNKVQLLILGDYMQGLYEFKGSDIRYLTFGDCIWEKHPLLNTPNFEHCTMKMSYRITNQIRDFVNNVLIGNERMDSCRDDQPVHYIRNSRQNMEKIVYSEIIKLFEIGIKPSDIFVLGPSVKGDRSNIRRLENMLVERGIPCHVPMLESADIDQRVIQGKVVFSTFHSIKGRQRKYVFVVGFDHSYFKFYARNLPRHKCPNTIYVACTRSQNGLYVMENDSSPKDRPIDFMKMSHVEMKEKPYIKFRGMQKTLFEKEEEEEIYTSVKITPTDLIKFIPEEAYQEICVLLENIFEKETSSHYNIELPSLIETKCGYFEEISDLNGIAIPSMYYDHLRCIWKGSQIDKTKDSVLYQLIEMNKENIKEKKKHFLQEKIDSLSENLENIDTYLFMANINQSITESLYFKLKQINNDEYTWLNQEQVDACMQQYKEIISVDCQNECPMIEEYIIHSSDEEGHKNIDKFTKQFIPEKDFRFSARADIITENILWELKCCSSITTDHMLQLAIYAWLWKMKNTENKKQMDCKLFNVKNGELWKMNVNMENLNKIMEILLTYKYKQILPKHDELFLQDCHDFIETFT